MPSYKRALNTWAVLRMLKNFTDLPNSFVNVKVQFSSDIERNSIVAATLILHCDKRYSYRMALLNRIRDLGRSRINRQIQQSIAALFGGKVLLDFLICWASSRGHLAYNTHILYMTAWLLAPSGYQYACVSISGDLPSRRMGILIRLDFTKERGKIISTLRSYNLWTQGSRRGIRLRAEKAGERKHESLSSPGPSRNFSRPNLPLCIDALGNSQYSSQSINFLWS